MRSRYEEEIEDILARTEELPEDQHEPMFRKPTRKMSFLKSSVCILLITALIFIVSNSWTIAILLVLSGALIIVLNIRPKLTYEKRWRGKPIEDSRPTILEIIMSYLRKR